VNRHPTQWHPRNNTCAQVLVEPYTKPERVGSIYLPEAYKYDASWTLWESVRAGQGAADYLDGYELCPGDIIVTLRRLPPFVGEADGTRLFVMDLETCGFRSIVTWEA